MAIEVFAKASERVSLEESGQAGGGLAGFPVRG